jgi:aryl-alcohol dehydrogenase-like predicted oxidoreductase
MASGDDHGRAAGLAGRPGAAADRGHPRRRCPADLALAWQLQGSPQALPIPGTTSLAHLRENLAAWSIVLSEREMRAIDAIATPGDLA